MTPAVAAEMVVADVVVAELAFVELRATMRALATTHHDGRLTGAIRDTGPTCGSWRWVGGALGTPSVSTVGSRVAAQAVLAVTTMVAPQVLTAEVAMVPGEFTVRGPNGDDG